MQPSPSISPRSEQIDFSPLQSKVSYRERTSQKHGWLIPLLFVLAGLLIYAPVKSAIVSGDVQRLIDSIVIYAAAAAAVAASMYHRAGQIARLRRFADLNDLTYRSNTSYDGRDGLIFKRGHSKKFLDILSAEGYGLSEIANYQYETGSGRSRTTHTRGFVRIKLDRHLPHMILDAKSNNFIGSNLNHGFTNEQRLSLEGDFDKYFQLYAPPEYKRDALYIFTPDVMASMIDAASAYDCEIIDNSMYLYTSRRIKLTDTEQMRELFLIAEKVRRQINKQASNYADERVGDRQRDMVAYSGARLRKNKTVFEVIAVTAVLILFAWMGYLMLIS